MTDDEIGSEIARQVQDALAQLAAALRVQGETGGPVSRKTVNRVADAVQDVMDRRLITHDGDGARE